MQVIVTLPLSKMGLPQARGFVNAVDALCNDYTNGENVAGLVLSFRTQCKAMNDLYSGTKVKTCKATVKVADKERIQQLISARQVFAGLARHEGYTHQAEAAKAYDALMGLARPSHVDRQTRSAFFIEALDIIAKLGSAFVASNDYTTNIKPLIDKQKAYSDAETNLATAKGETSRNAKKKAVKACVEQIRTLVSNLEYLSSVVNDADAAALLSKIEGLMKTEVTTVKLHEASVVTKRLKKEEQQREAEAKAEQERQEAEKQQRHEAIVLDQMRTEEAYNYLKQNHPDMLK